ncbi:hypothetical protein CCU68_04350 [Pseudomonas gingeri NCPPB 3146 = LMG 5327]|uniref:Uncharacterized protein n=2 Tax=Pseudomonas gingeri TaxID=117681 RepID=A0A7Y7Y5P0_9PSED|nr:hypothetical protein [Pseudomonas gingeri]NWA10154.1 hypothetical protein [Pseudomonas gingeri]NWC18333.1 hypothetical protein [Pseudomonas gingeri]NWE46297.1 hypothetical protein [Pseudomonas gingeri]NWE69016.1 hypothetical protein [Pseudomonas gingeri]PNQ93823.1 hypothetical protein CCU68_04350 [Pseudomonas gingeri NCPPB 3146 = LMG 5327]
MRLTHLFAFAAPALLLLPLSAHADWPAGQREAYMKDCTAAASKSVPVNVAQQHCACGADRLKEKFTTEQISQLMNTKKEPSKELKTDALNAIAACRVVK